MTLDTKRSPGRRKKTQEEQINIDVSELHLSEDLTRTQLVENAKFLSWIICSFLCHVNY